MKKIIKFFKQKYGLVLGCLVGALFGFSLISFIVAATDVPANNQNIKASAQAATGSSVVCTTYSCGEGDCGVVCCAPSKSTGAVNCKVFNGGTWTESDTVSF